MRDIKVSVTTDGSGDGTTTSTTRADGVLYAVQLVDGDFADGVDVTLTIEQGDVSVPVLIKANFNTDTMTYPRVPETAAADGTALTSVCYPIAFGFPKALIAQGGATKSGTFIFYVLDM